MGRTANRKWVALALTGVVVGMFVLSSSLQDPVKTRLRLVFAPQVPVNLASTNLSVISEPRHPMFIVPSGGVVSSFTWSPLIESTRSWVWPAQVLDDGVVFEVVDPRLSLGAQRASELEVSIDGIAFAFDVGTLLGECGYDRVGCSCGERRPVRPTRWWNRAPNEALQVSESLSICRGRENIVVVDNSPLPFLNPDPIWDQYFSDGKQLPYSNFRARAHLGGAELPFAGADLKYSLEDELTGVPYAHPEALDVTAKVVDSDDLTDVSPTCRKWTGKLTKACWREFAALANGPSCSKIWPITLDRKDRVLHLDFIGTPGHGCSLLMGVVAPEGDSMHAMLVDLWAPKDARSP